MKHLYKLIQLNGIILENKVFLTVPHSTRSEKVPQMLCLLRVAWITHVEI